MTEEQEKEIAIRGDEWASTRTADRGGYYFAGLSEGYYNGYLAGAEPREKRIAELEAQIEKMKNCKNCANYMISGKCPGFYKTGWCKNWEMTRSKK